MSYLTVGLIFAISGLVFVGGVLIGAVAIGNMIPDIMEPSKSKRSLVTTTSVIGALVTIIAGVVLIFLHFVG